MTTRNKRCIGYVITFIIVWYVYWKTDKKWQLGYLFGLFFVLLFTVRVIVEFFKESQGAEFITGLSLNTGQLLSIPFILIGLYLMFRKKETYNPKSS